MPHSTLPRRERRARTGPGATPGREEVGKLWSLRDKAMLAFFFAALAVQNLVAIVYLAMILDGIRALTG